MAFNMGTYWVVKWRDSNSGPSFTVDFDTREEAEDEAEGLRARGAVKVEIAEVR